MNSDPNLELLQKEGDPLEILICEAGNDLLPVLLPYARVWANHIYPRREGDGSEVASEWMPFASSHYTSLIRLYHAYEAQKNLQIVCNEIAELHRGRPSKEHYVKLLKIHGICAAFWENLGSAIDTFFRSRFDARKLLPQTGRSSNDDNDDNDNATNGKTVSSTKYPYLAFAYDRRTQFIHSRLVPKKLEEGMVIFNIRHYDDEITSWPKDREKPEMIDTEVQKNWHGVIAELSSAWNQFSSWLQGQDKPRPSQMRAVVETVPYFGSNPLSGVDQSRSNAFNIPPSGSKMGN